MVKLRKIPPPTWQDAFGYSQATEVKEAHQGAAQMYVKQAFL